MAKVSKPLLSAAQVTKAGVLAFLDGPGQESYLLHKKTGSRTGLKLDNGVYVLDSGSRNRVFEGRAAK